MRNVLWCTLLLVICIVSVPSYTSVSAAQHEDDSLSFPRYYSSNRVDKYLESTTERLEPSPARPPGEKEGNGDLKSITVVDYGAPSPLQGKKIPFSASSIDPCGDGSNQFATEAGGIRWKSFPITYAIDTSNSGVNPTTARNAVIGAFNDFDSFMPGQAFAISNNFATAEITFEWQPIDGPGGVLGIATFTFNPNTLEIFSAEIVLDSGESWFVSSVHSCAGMGNSFDIQNIAAHELGHGVGLGHVNDNLQTMFPTAAAGETLKRSLGNGDRAGLHFLYPSPSDWSQWASLRGGLRDDSDPAVIANSDGRLQVFIVGSDNRLYTKWQNTAGSTTSWSSPYHRLFGSIEPNTSPAVIMNSDGRLEVFIVGSDNRLYSKWQNTAGATTSWSSPFLSNAGVIAPGTSPAVVMNSDGRLQVFIVGSDNQLYTKWQRSPGSSTSWHSWLRLGGGIEPGTSPAVERNSDGRLQVFIVGNNKALYTKWQNTAGATTSWSPYLRLGGGIEPGTSPAVERNSDGRLQVFIVGNNKALYTKWQNTAGATTSWSPYLRLGGILAPDASPAVERNSDGRLQVFIVGGDNRLYSKWQNTAGSTTSWSPYLRLNGGIEPGTSPAVERNSDGRLEVFIIGNNKELYTKWQNTAGATTSWSPYLRLGGILSPDASPAVERNSDGRLEVFVVGSDRALYHQWQDVTNGVLPSIKDPNLTVEHFADGLFQPTSMAFIDANNILVVEKTGQVRLVSNGQLQPQSILQIPVNSQSERGLLGLAVMDSSVFLYYTEPAGLDFRNRVYKYTWDGQSLENPVLLLDLPGTPGPNHDGGKLMIGPDNFLYAVIGDLNRDGKLQNFPNGPDPDDTSVILRVNPNDGTAAPGNPFSSNPNDPLSKYYAYGIRNSFGLAFDPVNGKVWDTENGPNVFDEINSVNSGFNSGWQKVMGPISESTVSVADLVNFAGSHYADPILSWRQPIGITDLEFFPSSQLGLSYRNNLFVGDINNGNLYYFKINANRNGFVLDNTALSDSVVDNSQELSSITLSNGYTGITDVLTGPDGLLYILSFQQGKIFRITGS